VNHVAAFVLRIVAEAAYHHWRCGMGAEYGALCCDLDKTAAALEAS
jgi:hypothetical protein